MSASARRRRCCRCVTVITVAVLLSDLGQVQSGYVGCRPPGTAALSRVLFSVPASPPPAPSVPPSVPSVPEPAAQTAERPGATHLSPDHAVNTSEALVFQPGTWARYSCDPGYVMVGDSLRICLDTGQWTGDIPRCYLNVAEHSSLAAAHSPLVDGDLATSDDLLALFEGGRPLFIDLYFPFPLLELRLLTIYNLTGMSIQVRLSENNVSWIGFSMQLDAPQPPRPEVRGLVIHTISLQNTLLKNGARFIKVSLFHSSGAYFKRAPFSPVWPLHELQIVAQSTGLSRHQCLDDLGRSDVAVTWAAGDRCYHLVSERATRQQAEDTCRRLGDEGTLFRDTSTGLHAMVVDILRYRRFLKLARTSDVWSGGVRDPSPGQADQPVPPGSCLAVRRRFGWNTVQVACEARFRFVCQRAPRLCGSPPQKPNLIYNRARPTIDGGVINVTCVDAHLTTGHIQCHQRTWTQPNFCDRRPRPSPPSPKSQPWPTPSVHTVPETTTDSGTAEPKKSSDESIPATRKYLGAIIGGVVGGTIVLAVIAVLLICNSRHKDDKLTHEPYNFMEFWGLGRNQTHKQEEDDHVYSEVGGPEAIYEEPRFASGPGRPRHPPSIRPPPLPQERAPTSTLETVVSHGDSDYELCPTLDSKATAAAVAAAAAARAGEMAFHRTSTMETLVCGEDLQRETEYSVPFAGPAGRLSRGGEVNSSFARSSVDGGTVPQRGRAVSLATSEGPYALPYDPRADDVSDADSSVEQRRSVPDVVSLTARYSGSAR
ncbi:uncharacterized protein LOC122368931 [Amphibalanus amphitrite]|uniref:uncharacterized protein LOC122368931 n=1 Tax=Amphibalanus amphitrite TaxID=1232801 RepID=UPI001C90EC3F|nr:uncharacterized protein LOC122368931 [Amphibalanus amphitrite]